VSPSEQGDNGQKDFLTLASDRTLDVADEVFHRLRETVVIQKILPPTEL
jgi:hypothetical protein